MIRLRPGDVYRPRSSRCHIDEHITWTCHSSRRKEKSKFDFSIETFTSRSNKSLVKEFTDLFSEKTGVRPNRVVFCAPVTEKRARRLCEDGPDLL